MVTFVHTTDWHLGFFQHNLNDRFKDYQQAALEAVKKIIKIKPDFVLHTGDLFHHARPTPGAIRQAVRLFRLLERANIPTYIIRGNHDGRASRQLNRGGGVIKLLNDLKLVHEIDDTVRELPNLGIDILGIGYYPGYGVVKKLDELLKLHNNFLESDNFKILAFHAFVEGQLEEISHISLSKISELGVDYVGVGHHHIPWTRPKQNIYAPGSTEATSTNDWSRPDTEDEISCYSSFFEVNINGDNTYEVSSHKIPVRPKIFIERKIEENEPQVISKILTSTINEKLQKIKEIEPKLANRRPMIKVFIDCDLRFDQIAELNAQLEHKFSQSLNFDLVTDGKDVKRSIHEGYDYSSDVEQIILDEIGLEVGEATGYIKIITNIIEELGHIPSSRSLADDTFEDLLELFGNEEVQKIKEDILKTGDSNK